MFYYIFWSKSIVVIYIYYAVQDFIHHFLMYLFFDVFSCIHAILLEFLIDKIVYLASIPNKTHLEYCNVIPR